MQTEVPYGSMRGQGNIQCQACLLNRELLVIIAGSAGGEAASLSVNRSGCALPRSIAGQGRVRPTSSHASMTQSPSCAGPPLMSRCSVRHRQLAAHPSRPNTPSPLPLPPAPPPRAGCCLAWV